MKKIVIFSLFLALPLSSCSLLQRADDSEEKAEERPQAKVQSTGQMLEDEVSRLNTKVSALETKMDVLTSNLERMQVQRSQPIIEAQQSPVASTPSLPQQNLAAPVEIATETHVQAVSAPEPPSVLPQSTKSVSPPKNSTEVERDFRSAMQQFQNGKNLEAAHRFSTLAQKFPLHPLASHALYWAGEANARAQQWSMAIEAWEDLEKNYPRSAYLPESLSGLARAYDSQGDVSKAKNYRETLIKAFPKSPVALNSASLAPQGKPTEETQKYPAYETPGDANGEE